MESKPPPEEGKEDKTQGTGSNKPCTHDTVKECELHLALTKKAAYLCLLQFEAVWNPDGTNDSHIYEDNRHELVSANRELVKEAVRLLFERITGKWSHDGGIQIDRFPEEAMTRLTWVGEVVG